MTTGITYDKMGKSYGSSLYGLGRYEDNSIRESPKDHKGFVFFVRPLMNMSRDNLTRDRKLNSLLTDNVVSVEAYVRSMLDPMLYISENLNCPMADPFQAFIPILTNNLVSLTGYQDVTVDSYTSTAGVRKQQYNLLDGTDDLYGVYDLNATFNNTYEDAVVMLITSWLRYVTKCKEGVVSPYRKFIARRMVDHHSRIFRLVMAEDKKTVKRIGATGPIVPDVNSVGKYYDYNKELIYNDQIKTHSIKFKAMGLEYEDPILLQEFNKTVGAFNPMIRGINEGKTAAAMGLKRLSYGEEIINNYRGYCRINLQTRELEWYVIDN